MVGDLRNRSRLYGLPTLADAGGLIESAEEHLTLLLEHLAAGEQSAAEHLITHHLGHLRSLWSAASGKPKAD